jgi:hypothetical protein
MVLGSAPPRTSADDALAVDGTPMEQARARLREVH